MALTELRGLAGYGMGVVVREMSKFHRTPMFVTWAGRGWWNHTFTE